MKVQKRKQLLKQKMVLFDNKNYQKADVVTTSLHIAEAFEKEHKNVLRDIDKIKADLLSDECDFSSNLDATLSGFKFEESEYIAENGKRNRLIILNQQSAMLIVMGFSGKKALFVKAGFINQFKTMATELDCIKRSRLSGKLVRTALTDSIQNNVPDMGKTNKYSYITNMIYSEVFGETAKALRIKHDCKTNDLLRDYLDDDKLSRLYKIEKHVAVLLSYYEPKKALSMASNKIKV